VSSDLVDPAPSAACEAERPVTRPRTSAGWSVFASVPPLAMIAIALVVAFADGSSSPAPG
jgi:hypothetical protein